MMTQSMMYWITTLDSIVGFERFLCFLCVILFVIFLVCWLCMVFDGEAKNKKKEMRYALKGLFWTAAALLMFALAMVFTPSTKQMAAILLFPRVANSETVKELGEGISDLARQWVEELKPKKAR